MRLLLIKLTSLGDVIHALPACSDAQDAHPDLQIDWVIDRRLQEVAHWHPSIQKVFLTDHRAWIKHPTDRKTRQDFVQLIEQMRGIDYDLIIDAQGNFKSALLSCFAKGLRGGYDRGSVREWIAHLAYQKTAQVSRKLHAVDRIRNLFSQLLDYPLPPSPPEFRIHCSSLIQPSCQIRPPYLVMIPNTAWQSKIWPEDFWKQLILKACDEGFSVLIPWGNLEEKARAQRLQVRDAVYRLPALSLSELGHLFKHSHGVFSVDTGLSHLAAALQVPTVTIYGSTNPEWIGAKGARQKCLMSSLPCSPCSKKTCPLGQFPSPCLERISPKQVWEEFQSL